MLIIKISHSRSAFDKAWLFTQLEIRELMSRDRNAQNDILCTCYVSSCSWPSLPLPLLPIGTAATAGGPQRGGPNGPPLLPATEDVCSSEWELFGKELRVPSLSGQL